VFGKQIFGEDKSRGFVVCYRLAIPAVCKYRPNDIGSGRNRDVLVLLIVGEI
jgi:hypothetical protein